MTRSLTVVGSEASRCSDVCTLSPPKQPLERMPRLVVADDAEQRHPRAQRRGVARDVGGAAGTLLAARDLDDRHRRLGRNALDVAEPVAIEHHVADDQHARATDRIAEIAEASRARRHQGLLTSTERALAAADPEVFDAGRAHQRRVEQIAAVEDQRLLQRRRISSKSGLRNSFHSVTITQRVGAGARRPAASSANDKPGVSPKTRLRLVHRDRIVGGDGRAAREQARR